MAKVAVEKAAYRYDRAFDYLAPETLDPPVRTGCRVAVPFGRSNRKRQGIVLGLEQRKEASGLKPVLSVLDRSPLLTEEAVSLTFWLKEHTFCTLFEAARLFLPAGVFLRLSTRYSLARDAADRSISDEDGRKAAALLARAKAPVAREKILKDLGLAADSDLLERLCAAGILTRSESAVRQVGDAKQKMVRCAENACPPKLTPKQACVYGLLQEAGCASVKELCYFAGTTPSVVGALVAKGAAEFYDLEVYRNPYADAQYGEDTGQITLTPEQDRAYRGLLGRYREGKGGVSLLYGVTGSGKTSVFMRLIDDVRADGREVIVMVPEISLTPQTIALFRRRYGNSVAVFHSGLTLAERLDEWKRVNNGDASIVVGTRSAVFAPFRNLGLIIVDEEQEGTYKSESSPRYHAREVAKYRCAYHKALLVLSSATPSVESYYSALSGRYGLEVLPERYGGAQLPEVTVADMNLERERGNSGLLSEVLADALRENLERGRQSILLLNRRGYNTFVSCRACGHVMTCPNCSISMTYHAANNRLMCHYCGYSVPFTQECPSCHENEMRYAGYGTQRAEEQLGVLLPGARILRLDADSTMTRFAYEKKLKRFREGEYDVIVGTQMVAKGLDFENVTLVGVLSADQALYGDDFRSYERAFDLLTQVVGRSGRGRFAGRAVIQTFTPENEIIALAARQDFPGFYRGEIALRKAMLYPPFADLCVVGFVGRSEEKVRGASAAFLKLFRATARSKYPEQPLRVLNPSPAIVGKVSNRYRYKMIVKCRDNRVFRKMMSDLLIRFSDVREFTEVTVFCDMNPDVIL